MRENLPPGRGAQPCTTATLVCATCTIRVLYLTAPHPALRHAHATAEEEGGEVGWGGVECWWCKNRASGGYGALAWAVRS